MRNWYEQEREAILKELNVHAARGLSSSSIDQLQTHYGKNEFAEQKKDGLGKRILHQLKDVSTIILIIAAALSLWMGIAEDSGFMEPIVIMAIVVMNIILAITQEGKAERSMEALSRLNSPHCVVLRDGAQQKIVTSELVPGDIIVLEPGSLVPADARLLTSTELYVDEAALTGESDPAEKNSELELSGKVPLGDQLNMVFSGCLVTAGRATAVVVATGMETQMGHIAGFLNNSQKLKTPLQLRLNKVAKAISAIAIVAAIFLLATGIRMGGDAMEMVLLAISLAVAAVPETLMLIVTLSLTNGVNNMVKDNTLIRKLHAVETLGNTSVICSDKTGTLTQNKMTIKRLWIKGGEPFDETASFSDSQTKFLKLLAMASNATIETDDDGITHFVGNPTELAIMHLMADKGYDKTEIEAEFPKVAEIPFSSERKMMTVALKDPEGGYLVITKGALDRLPLLPLEEADAAELQQQHDAFADAALRIIALGLRHVDELPVDGNLESLEQELNFLGIIGLIDPPREDVKEAIATAQKAGIRTIMITGDHAATAAAIARDIGILSPSQKVLSGTELSEMSDEELHRNIEDYSVYARVSPEDKIRIVEAWQEKDEVVAMTGDGVNDAPALKAADVGVAMGKSGTEVAKSASDIVLTDDNFASIVKAVHQGRNVYSNIRKTLYFLLVCNLSEIFVMLFAQMSGWGILVTPVMLLLINVLGDGIPGLHLAKETSDPRIMENPPVKRKESFFSGGLLAVIIRQTIVCSVVVLVAYYLGAHLYMSPSLMPSHAIGQTMAFLVLGWTSILHIFTVRSRVSIFKRTFFDNKPLIISAAAMIAVFALMVAIAPVGGIFGLTTIGGMQWLTVIGLSLIPTIVAELGKFMANHVRARIDKKRLVKHFDYAEEEFD